MPLSKEQIEIEKAKFEEFIINSDYWDDEDEPEWLPDLGFYMNDEHNIAFAAWIACRESIEIVLPKAATKLNHFDDPMKIYYAGDLIPHLEAQGFKVKS